MFNMKMANLFFSVQVAILKISLFEVVNGVDHHSQWSMWLILAFGFGFMYFIVLIHRIPSEDNKFLY